MIQELNKKIIINVNDEFNSDIEVPYIVEKRIRGSYKKIKRNKRFMYFTKSIAATSILIILSSLILINNPALAEEIPIIKNLLKGNSLFEVTKDKTWILPSENYRVVKYSTAMNVTSKDKGIEITLKEAVYDGSDVFLAYIIKGDKPFEFVDKDFISCVYEGKDVKMTGNNFMCDFRSEPVKIDDKTYIVRENFKMSLDRTPSYEVEIDMSIHKIANVNGEWNLKFNVNMDSMKGNAKLIKLNKKIKNFGRSQTLTFLSVSPLTSKLEYVNNPSFIEKLIARFKEKDTSVFPDYSRNLIIVDDKGRGLKYSGLSESNLGGKINFKLADENLPEYLTIIPVKNKFPGAFGFYNLAGMDIDDGKFSEKVYSKYKDYGSLNNLPVEIDNGKFGKAAIKKIETKDGFIEIYITIEGKYIALYEGEILFYDKRKPIDKINSYGGIGLRYDRLGDNEYVVRIPKDHSLLDIKKLDNYEVMMFPLEERYIVSGKEIKININK